MADVFAENACRQQLALCRRERKIRGRRHSYILVSPARLIDLPRHIRRFERTGRRAGESAEVKLHNNISYEGWLLLAASRDRPFFSQIFMAELNKTVKEIQKKIFLKVKRMIRLLYK